MRRAAAVAAAAAALPRTAAAADCADIAGAYTDASGQFTIRVTQVCCGWAAVVEENGAYAFGTVSGTTVTKTDAQSCTQGCQSHTGQATSGGVSWDDNNDWTRLPAADRSAATGCSNVHGWYTDGASNIIGVLQDGCSYSAVVTFGDRTQSYAIGTVDDDTIAKTDINPDCTGCQSHTGDVDAAGGISWDDGNAWSKAGSGPSCPAPAPTPTPRTPAPAPPAWLCDVAGGYTCAKVAGGTSGASGTKAECRSTCVAPSPQPTPAPSPSPPSPQPTPQPTLAPPPSAEACKRTSNVVVGIFSDTVLSVNAAQPHCLGDGAEPQACAAAARLVGSNFTAAAAAAASAHDACVSVAAACAANLTSVQSELENGARDSDDATSGCGGCAQMPCDGCTDTFSKVREDVSHASNIIRNKIMCQGCGCGLSAPR